MVGVKPFVKYIGWLSSTYLIPSDYNMNNYSNQKQDFKKRKVK